MPRLIAMGLAPAATLFSALAIDRLREDRRRGGAVAGDVGRLGRDFAHHLGAQVLEPVVQLDLLGDGHAVLRHVGPPNFFSRTTLRPLGPSVTRTASASLLTPAQVLPAAQSSP